MRIAAFIISLLLAACSSATVPAYDRLPDIPGGESGAVSISYLKSLAAGRSTVIDRDIFIEGYVVANDWLGEYYKTIVVTDDSGGIEIGIDRFNIYQTIPMHAPVTISCNGLALGRVGGKTTLGAKATGEYTTDRIASADVSRYIKISDALEMPDPLEITIGELSVEHISRFVCLRGLRSVEEERGLAWCDRESDGEIAEDEEEEDDDRYLTWSERHFIDNDGNILTVRTLDRCHYRSEAIPDRELTLAGIADYADGKYFLRIINHYIF